MTKAIYYNVHMISHSLIFISALACLPLVFQNDPDYSVESTVSSNGLKTVFVYFTDLAINPNSMKLEGTFTSIDGKKTALYGNYVEPTVLSNANSNSRLWAYNIPSKTFSSEFKIYFEENGKLNEWSRTGLYRVDGPIFYYSTNHYSDIGKETGWKKTHHFSTKEYADFFISKIDPNKKEGDYSLLYYTQIYDYFFKSLTDYSNSTAESTCWDDEFVGKTNLLSKERLLEEKSKGFKNNDFLSNMPIYLLGVCLLISAGYLTIRFYKKHRNEK